MQAANPFTIAMRALPLLYGASVGTILWLVLLITPATQAWPGWLTAVVTLAVSVAIAVAVQLLLVPQLRHKMHSWGHRRDRVGASLAWQVEAASPQPKMSVL